MDLNSHQTESFSILIVSKNLVVSKPILSNKHMVFNDPVVSNKPMVFKPMVYNSNVLNSYQYSYNYPGSFFTSLYN